MRKKFDITHPLKDMVQAIKDIAAKDFSDAIDFIPGFEDFQKVLAENEVKHSIATNADEPSFKLLIKKCGFDQMFGEHLYCADQAGGRPKPDPAVFLHEAEKLGVSPEDCIVFEDSIYGFKAAKAAGMRCIAIKNEKNADIVSMVDAHIEHYDQAHQALHDVCDQIEAQNLSQTAIE